MLPHLSVKLEMSVSRILGRALRNALVQCRNSLFLSASRHQHQVPLLSNHFHSLREPATKASLLHDLLYRTSPFQHFGISTSASPKPSEKETTQAGQEHGNSNTAESDIDSKASAHVEEAAGGDAEASERKQESDSEGDLDNLSKDDLLKLVMEKEEGLKMKQKQIAEMQDKVLRSYAEIENVMDRTRRESEISKKFAIQNFAKSLLDVADNLGRASLVVKDSFTKIEVPHDTAGAVPLLKTLLEGVEMTEKQLLEVFKRFGLEKYDPTNEQFDPNRHNAVFQVPDNSKPPGTVATVLKLGYTLHDRVIRPAEVGVTQAVENEAN
ncbi:hypothetical protein Ancab_025090 [Ancistrocladus abbreviatus]